MLLGTVLSWYRHDVSFSAELIDSFVRSVEKQVADSIVRYEEEKQTQLVHYDAGEDGVYAAPVETHEGLESETWNLETIFKEYLPNLQRRSAFLTVYGYFECELDKLCFLYAREKHFQQGLLDQRGKGIDRSTSYLKEVAVLDMHKESPVWIHIKELQDVRDVIVHADGRLQPGQKPHIRRMIAKLVELVSLNAQEEIILKEGFLLHVTDACKSYFRLIDQSIRQREQAYPSSKR